MSIDLILKPSCRGCGSTVGLFGSSCKHLTLCEKCGRVMAENRAKCYECGNPITRLIQEHNIWPFSRHWFISKFSSGLPNFKKKNENKWSLHKEGRQGRQVTDSLREKYKNKPWLLEDETGQFQYQGLLDGQSATYYFLVRQGKDIDAIPVGSWYNFNKVAQYKQLTLEEAEEKIKNRRKTADGYGRWMMKAAKDGPAAFGEVEKNDDRETSAGGGRGRKKTTGDEDEANASDRGEDEELNKRGWGDDEEGPAGSDLDFDDDDIEKGDDWEHEEIFTDDDEAVDIDDEREDLEPEIPAPPEIKQDDDDDDEGGEGEGGGLSTSGKELKKLLGRVNKLNDSDAEDDDDDDDMEDDISPVLVPKKEAPKEEPVDNSSPLKSSIPGAGRGTPSTSKSSKGKRKSNGEESQTPNNNNAPPKKVKTENEVKSVKDEPASFTKTSKNASPQSSSKVGNAVPTGPVTEDEIRAVLMQRKPVTTQDLVAKFKSRLKLKEDKDAFAAILRRISKIQKTNGANYVVLRERVSSV